MNRIRAVAGTEEEVTEVLSAAARLALAGLTTHPDAVDVLCRILAAGRLQGDSVDLLAATLARTPRDEWTPLRTNLDDAADLIVEIERTRSILREVKAAFARSELDGGAKAALSHPLYLQAETHLEHLHNDLMMLI